jgi:hypothetical protein
MNAGVPLVGALTNGNGNRNKNGRPMGRPYEKQRK